MKSTNVLVILAAALAVSCADVSAMKRSVNSMEQSDSRAHEGYHLRSLREKKERFGFLTPEEQETFDMLEQEAEDAEKREAKRLGLKTKKVMVLESQIKSVTEATSTINEVCQFLGWTEDLGDAMYQLSLVEEMVYDLEDIDFVNVDEDPSPLVIGKDGKLEYELAKTILALREKIQALVQNVCSNNKLDMKNDNDIEALYASLNKMLVKVGCPAIEVGEIIVLKKQIKAVADMITQIEDLTVVLGFAENIDDALMQVEMVERIIISVASLSELKPETKVTDEVGKLKLELAKQLVVLCDKAQLMVEAANNNENLAIRDVSIKSKKKAVGDLLAVLNKILVKVGCDKIDVQVDMNTDLDLEIAQAEHAKYLQDKNMQAARDEAYAREVAQAENPQEDEDPELAQGIAMSLEEQKNKEQDCIIS